MAEGSASLDSGFRKVASAADITSERPHAASSDGIELVLVRSGQGILAYDARCPHQGTLLSEGEIVDGQLVCRGHGWRFDVASGECQERPPLCLRAFPTKVEGQDVLVRLDGRTSGNPLLDLARAKRKLADLPGPSGWPLFGNALQIDVPRVHRQLEDWSRQYGPLYKLNVMGNRMLVIADAQLAESVLRARPTLFRRTSPLERIFAEMGTAGVFSAEGSAWRAQRRLAMQALSNRHLRTFFPTLRRVAERLRKRWAGAAVVGSAQDIDGDLMRFTVDVTTSLVFSTDLNTLEGDDDDVLQRHLSHVFPAFARRILGAIPYWRFIRLPRDRALDRALAEVRAVQERLVSETRARLATREPNDVEPRDFVEAMLLARDEDNRPFSDEVVYGNMMTMLLAGEDTTAHTLAWVVHHLCERPDVVARMRAEVDRALGQERTPPDFESAQSLPYLDAVASETMRLRPVAPFQGLEANQDVVVGDVLVPKGAWVDILARLPALDADNFAEPEAFRPERWLDERASSEAHVPGASMPFGSGPRICPGRSLALTEMRVVLATLVRNFDVERIGDPDDVREHFAFTMSPRGLQVRLRARVA